MDTSGDDPLDATVRQETRVEWVPCQVTLRAEIQRNADGTWRGMIRKLSGTMLVRASREELLADLAALHSQDA